MAVMSLNGERRAAAAGFSSVGVRELEALAVQTIGKIENGSRKKYESFLWNVNLDAVLQEDLVGIFSTFDDIENVR